MGAIACPKCGAGKASIEWRDDYYEGRRCEEIHCLRCGLILGRRFADEVEKMTRIGDCVSCGQKRMSIVGRGMCSGCYRKARKEEEEHARLVEKADFDHALYEKARADAVGISFETEDGADELVVAAVENPVADVVDLSPSAFSAPISEIERALNSECQPIITGPVADEARHRHPDENQVGGSHYASKDVQPWHALESWMSKDQFVGYLSGNAITYLARWQDKGGVQDLRKAQHTLEKLIYFLEEQACTSAATGVVNR